MRTWLRLLASLAGLCACPGMAAAAPSLSDPVLSPSAWNSSPTALGGWTQNDFGGGLAGPATIQVNVSHDGSAADWRGRGTVAGPLVSGVRFAEFPVADLEGRFDVRVVIEGAGNSPLALGTLQLDRTPPVATSIFLTTTGGPVEADWIQSDALSGTDPGTPITVEVNAGPLGDAAGPWVAFRQRPEPGDGRKLAHTDLAGLPDGRHLVRARTRDRAGNAADLGLGTVVSDRTPPVVTGVRVARPASAAGRIAEIAYSAIDAGVGMVGAPRAQVAPPGADDGADLVVPGASSLDRVAVLLPGAGVHLVTVRVRDALGNRTESAPLAIQVPTPQEEADRRVEPRPRAPVAGSAGDAPGAQVLWAVARVRGFQSRRGLRLRSAVLVARSATRWRSLLGAAGAGRYTAYTTFRGDLLLGPAATRGLDALGRGRRAGPRAAPSHADLDAMVMGLAVLLHESLHATGPVAAADIRGTRSGRAFEEGFVEATTVDLLPSLIGALDVPPPLGAGLRAAARRYRPAYRAERSWARRMSARATRRPAGSPAARGFRAGVTDRWGSDRWTRLARATGLGEAALRADAIER